MDLIGSGNDTGEISSHNYNFSSNISAFNNTQASNMRSPCDGRFSWTVHGPLIVVCVLIIAFNSVVIALMRWKETLRTRSNIILVSLAVSDLMSGLFGIPLIFGCSVTNSLARSGPSAACVSSVLFMRFTAVSTALHFVLVACDRFVMIKFSLQYSTIITWPRVKCALIAIWLIPPAVATVQLAWYKAEDLRETKEEDTVYFLVLIVAFFAMPMLFMLCIYGHIIVVSIHHLRAMRALRENLGETIKSRSIARDMRGTVIFISMLVVFAGCWSPFFLMIVQSYTQLQIFSSSSWGLCFVLFVRFIPPMTNPMFCALCKRDFRNSLRAKMRSRGVGFSVPSKKMNRRRKVNFCVICAQSESGLADSSEKNYTESSIGLSSTFQERVEFQSSV